MKLKVLATVACILIACSPVMAHEFLIKSQTSEVEKGKAITIDVVETHVFIVPEELPVLKDVLLSFVQGQGSSQSVALTAMPKEHLLRGSISPGTNDNIVVLGKRLPQLWSETTEGILEGDRKALESQGKKVLSVGSYEKYALLFIPGKDSKQIEKYNIPGEHPPLLIAPLFDPNNVKVGQKLQFAVTLNGSPITTELPISATYDGYSKEESVFAITTKSDIKGIVTITPTTPGLWLINTETKEKLTNSNVDDKSIRSSTLFWVKQ